MHFFDLFNETGNYKKKKKLARFIGTKRKQSLNIETLKARYIEIKLYTKEGSKNTFSIM